MTNKERAQTIANVILQLGSCTTQDERDRHDMSLERMADLMIEITRTPDN